MYCICPSKAIYYQHFMPLKHFTGIFAENKLLVLANFTDSLRHSRHQLAAYANEYHPMVSADGVDVSTVTQRRTWFFICNTRNAFLVTLVWGFYKHIFTVKTTFPNHSINSKPFPGLESFFQFHNFSRNFMTAGTLITPQKTSVTIASNNKVITFHVSTS